MGRKNVLITAAVLVLGGAVFGIASAASGDASDLDAELGPAVVANVDATSGATATPRNLTPTAVSSSASPATPSSIRPDDDDDDEPQQVRAPKPKQLVDDEDEDEPDENEPDEQEPEENEGDDGEADDGDDD